MVACGEIEYGRTYFKSKEIGERTYLTNCMVGIKLYMRISNDIISYKYKYYNKQTSGNESNS
jgi:hypothetical protein